MEIKAKLNYFHIAPRKVRLVTGLIKGMDVKRAELELNYLPKRSALPLLKMLKSAVANARNNFQLEEKGLYIKDIQVNSGPVTKRFRARAFGRAAPIRKRTSHAILILDTRGEAFVKRSKQKQKKESPTIRDVTSEDIAELKEVRAPKEKFTGEIGSKPKTSGFVRKMFRRKVI